MNSILTLLSNFKIHHGKWMSQVRTRAVVQSVKVWIYALSVNVMNIHTLQCEFWGGVSMGPFSNFLRLSSSANGVSNHYSVIKMAP